MVTTHLLEVEVHHRDEVQRVCVVVVIWAAIAVVHPQLNQAALTRDHVHCMPHDCMGNTKACFMIMCEHPDYAVVRHKSAKLSATCLL